MLRRFTGEGGGCFAGRLVVMSVAAGSDCGAGDFRVTLLVIVLGVFLVGCVVCCCSQSIATTYLEIHDREHCNGTSRNA